VTTPTYSTNAYRLRRATGELLPVRYSDPEIDEILDRYTTNGVVDFDLASLEIWYSKAAEWANLTDVNESGSDRNLSQLHKQAVAQIKLIEGRVARRITGNADIQKAWRAVGVSATVWGPIHDYDRVLYGSNGSSNGPRA
jgi:hypothetical protein